MNIKEIIDAELWGSMRPAFREHNAALKRIQSAVLEDEATLMRQIKMWSDDCKKAEQRVIELEAELNNMHSVNKVVDKCIAKLGKKQSSDNDPILKAIDLAKWDDEDLDTFNTLSDWSRLEALRGANRQIEVIRSAYLADQKTAIKFAVETLNDTIELQDKHIAELEKQLPKVWIPKKGTHFYFCGCGCVVGYSERYCGQCGSKLNWEEV